MAAQTEADAETGKTGKTGRIWKNLEDVFGLLVSMVLVPGRFGVGLDAVEEKKTDHVSGRLLDYDDRSVLFW